MTNGNGNLTNRQPFWNHFCVKLDAILSVIVSKLLETNNPNARIFNLKNLKTSFNEIYLLLYLKINY